MTQFLTASFSLRKPTKRKQEVLEIAAKLYIESAQRVLDWCYDNLDRIKDEGQKLKKDGEKTGKFDGDSIKKVLPPLSVLRLPLASSVNEALVSDVAASVAGYLETVKVDPRTNFPTAIKEESESGIESERDYRDALSEFASFADNLEEENRLRDLLTSRRKTSSRPICWGRARDFAILCKPEQPDELYAWLPLLPGENAIIPRYNFDGSMIDLSTGEPFKKRSNMGVIVKLYTDSNRYYSLRFIRNLFEKLASIKSAKLVQRKGQWLLNVSMAFETPEQYTPQAYIGVSVGSMERIGFSVVGLDGKIIYEQLDEIGIYSLNAHNRRSIARRQRAGRFIDARHYKGQSQVEMLHLVANRMIEIAKRHRAMLVLEDFSIQKGADIHIKRGGRLTKLLSPWRKFEFIVNYKANLAGVPVRLGMWSAKAKSLCVYCGSACKPDKETHFQIMQCSACMARKHKQLIASANLARRMNYVKKEWDNKGGYLTFHRSLAVGLSQLSPIS